MITNQWISGNVWWGGTARIIADLGINELQAIRNKKVAVIIEKKRHIIHCENDIRSLQERAANISGHNERLHQENQHAQEKIDRQIADAKVYIDWFGREVAQIEAELEKRTV
ncbi:MAG: hypothetical protein EOP06_06830 [Proteobacteria bacterium]|nr:MAG: hypothetical protein EOP06_06830 [Pseudomonadota bacterium]